jgi:hypothetical protein
MEHNDLFSSMQKWGFDADLNRLTGLISRGNVDRISMVQFKGNDVLFSGWHIGKAGEEKELELRKIMVLLKKDLDVPEKWGQFDIKDLENRIRSVNWMSDNNEQLLKKLGSEKKLDEYISTILIQLAFLNEPLSREAKKIYDLLVFKYFINTPLEALMPKQEIDAIKKAHFRRLTIDPNSEMAIDVNQAYNVLDGRYSMIAVGADTFRWVKVDHAKKDENGVSVLEIIPGSEHFDLRKCIDQVDAQNPAMVKSDHFALYELSRGNRVIMTLEKEGIQGKRVFYADPVNDRLSIDRKETTRRGFYEDQSTSRDQSPGKGNDWDSGRSRKR